MASYRDALEYHANDRPGKLEVVPTKPLLTQRDLALAYSPGVAEPCLAIKADPEDAWKYTNRGNLVAVVSNGTAVLGLGNIGPLAGKPVMEGKANLFKKFADIDVFDIELDAPDVETFLTAARALGPTFGGINLEDIRAPECFEIERRLQEMLDIPVFHDDQHGTALIASAALLNACEITDRKLEDITCVFSGAGAAAVATARLFVSLGVKTEHIFMCDSKGLITTARSGPKAYPEKMAFAQPGEPKNLAECLVGADCFIGLSVAGVLSADLVEAMASQPLIFAMANPDPEIPYAVAREAVPDALIATGRSDHPNQVNNVLGFPFVFRGALDCRARCVNEAMKAAAVKALAQLAKEDVPDAVLRAYGLDRLTFGPDYLIPKPFDPRVLTRVAPAVAAAAAETGVARKPIADLDAYRERLEKRIEKRAEFMRPLINRAKIFKKRIVFPDGNHPKVMRAAQILADEGICQPVLIGESWKIHTRAEAANVDTSKFEIVEIGGDEQFDVLADQLWRSRQRKGFTLTMARHTLRSSTWYGCMMLRDGLADGMVGGLDRPYQDTLRPALQTIGRNPVVSTVSGVYAMLFKGRTLFFGDCTVVEKPTTEQLAQIAINTARVARAMGVSPKVALLSYSDFGEHRGSGAARVRDALPLIRQAWPELLVDGEVQADTAVNAQKACELFPFSALGGEANVLVFPNLTSGNIAYKLLRELGGATAVGPIIVGLRRPVNVLATGSSVDDIVNITALTVNQAVAG